MSSRGAGRKKPEARRAPTRAPKERFLVLTEGARTEKDYLEALARQTRGALVEVVVPPDHGMPTTLVRAAKTLRERANARARAERDDNLRFDAVWCVFDVDQHPNLKTAIEEARTGGIEVAVSNPCFELWLLLHFRESPGLRRGLEIVQLLRGFVAGYEKRVEFSAFAAGYGDAVKRAQRLQADADEVAEPNRNPTSGVWRLAEAIRRDAPLPGDDGASPLR
jgi:hypothetical protein